MRTVLITASVSALGFLPVQATTNAPFSIQPCDDIAWLAKPNGERFFSLGVCVVTQGASREGFNPTNPGYAAFQHYERAIKLEPRHRGAHEYIGEAYLMVGDLPSAEKHREQLRAICLLGCEELADLDKAIAAYKAKPAR